MSVHVRRVPDLATILHNMTLATIVVLFGSLAFFAGDATVTVNDGEITKPLATETPQPVPTAPVTE